MMHGRVKKAFHNKLHRYLPRVTQQETFDSAEKCRF